MLCAVMCARATGAHTLAVTTHSHNSNTPAMARRESVVIGSRCMASILGKHARAFTAFSIFFKPNQPLTLDR